MYIYIIHIQHPGEQGVGGPEIRAGEAQPRADRSATCPAEAPGGPDRDVGNGGNTPWEKVGKRWGKCEGNYRYRRFYDVVSCFFMDVTRFCNLFGGVYHFCSIFLIVFLLGWGESCFSKWTDVTMNISTVSTVNVEHSYSIMLIVPIYLF